MSEPHSAINLGGRQADRRANYHHMHHSAGLDILHLLASPAAERRTSGEEEGNVAAEPGAERG